MIGAPSAWRAQGPQARYWPEQSRLGSHPTSACDFLPRPSLTFLTAKHHCCFGNFWPIPNYTTNWWQMCMHVNSHFMKVQWPEAVTDGQITIAIGIYIVIWTLGEWFDSLKIRFGSQRFWFDLIWYFFAIRFGRWDSTAESLLVVTRPSFSVFSCFDCRVNWF